MKAEASFIVTFTLSDHDDLDVVEVGEAYLRGMDDQIFIENMATGLNIDLTYERKT